jgi:hypothetical protein
MTKNRIPILESIIEQHAERTDGCDLYTVLSIIADTEDDMGEFINSRTYWEIINATQSNPARAHNAIVRMHRADNAIARYDDEE